MLTKKMMLFSGVLILSGAISCKKDLTKDKPAAGAEALSQVSAAGGTRAPGDLAYDGSSFTDVAQNLGGLVSGQRMLVSNQPEQLVSRGWVFRTSVNDNSTGSLVTVTGAFTFYLYHYLLGSVGTGTKMYLVARNTSTTTVTVSGRGYYEVKSGSTDLSTSLRTAKNWLTDKRTGVVQTGGTGPGGTIAKNRPVSKTIGSGLYAILDEVSSPNSQTIDGRYELNATGGNVQVFLVFDNFDATPVANRPAVIGTYVTDATKRAQGTWTDSQGYIVEVGSPAPALPSGLCTVTAATRFGRECGIYNNTDWTGNTTITLPNTANSILKLHYNTSIKSGGQEQSADASSATVGGVSYRTVTPVDSRVFSCTDYSKFIPRPTNALKTYANYGHYFQPTFTILNTSGRPRHFVLTVGRAGGTRYYAPFWVRSNGFSSGNVDLIKDIILDPGVPGSDSTEKVLANVIVPNGATSAVIRLNAIIPGSISIGQFFRIKTLN